MRKPPGLPGAVTPCLVGLVVFVGVVLLSGTYGPAGAQVSFDGNQRSRINMQSVDVPEVGPGRCAANCPSGSSWREDINQKSITRRPSSSPRRSRASRSYSVSPSEQMMLNAVGQATYQMTKPIGEALGAALVKGLFGDPQAEKRKAAARRQQARQRQEAERQRLEEERWQAEQAEQERLRREAEARQQFLASKRTALASLTAVDFDGTGAPDFLGSFQPTLMDTADLDLSPGNAGVVDLRDKDVDQPGLSPSFANAPDSEHAELTPVPGSFSPTLMDTADLDLSPVGPATVDLRDKAIDQPVRSPSFAEATDQPGVPASEHAKVPHATMSAEGQPPPARPSAGWTASTPAQSPRQSGAVASVDPPGQAASSPAPVSATSGLPSPADLTNRHARIDFDGDGVPAFAGGDLRDALRASSSTQTAPPSVGPAVVDLRDKDMDAPVVMSPSFDEKTRARAQAYADRLRTRRAAARVPASPSPQTARSAVVDSRDKTMAADTATSERPTNPSASPRRPVLNPCGTIGDIGTRFIHWPDGTTRIVPCSEALEQPAGP